MFSYLWYFTVIIKGFFRTRVIGYCEQEENAGMIIKHHPQISEFFFFTLEILHKIPWDETIPMGYMDSLVLPTLKVSRELGSEQVLF